MPATTPVREIMTAEVVTLRADQTVAEAASQARASMLGRSGAGPDAVPFSTMAMKPRSCAKMSTSFVGGTATTVLNFRGR